MTGDRLAPLADELALIAGAAREAGRIAMRYFQSGDLDIRLKDGDSPVTAADFAVDTFLRETLTAARPAYGWLSEETADTDAKARMIAPRTFIVDPIDGTRAFIDGRDIWCISVAIVENGRPVAGVLECPALSETITATMGGGASRNGKAVVVQTPRETPVIAGPKPLVRRFAQTAPFSIERFDYVPSLAYRLSMIARSRIDGTFVKPASADWDIAAADLIVHEAGGILTDAKGNAPRLNGADPSKGLLVACHPALQAALLAVVAEPGLG